MNDLDTENFPWLSDEVIKEESEISYEELERGLKWLKGRFKNEWKKLLEEKRRLDENLRKKPEKSPLEVLRLVDINLTSAGAWLNFNAI